MKLFASTGDGARKGFNAGEFRSGLGGAIIDNPSMLSLFGAFGVNKTNLNENGNVNLSYASANYFRFLNFIETICASGAVFLSEDGSEAAAEGKIGWWSGYVRGMFGEYGFVTELLANNSEAKILITPPETGYGGARGVNAAETEKNPGGVSVISRFVINSGADDEKLAKILEIFDKVSYDEKLNVLVEYGEEGVDFEWEGMPYNSAVKKSVEKTDFPGVFGTGTRDERAGKYIYDFIFPSTKLYDYATSPSAVNMILFPYKDDPFETLESEKKKLMKKFGVDDIYLTSIAMKYLYEIVHGLKSVESSWDGYVAELYGAGLNDIIRLLEKYPVTN